ncbi:MAG: hypothetical protein JXA30_22725 [Deltaproteobacteria bacterium]|nr:hypothetical protein [Deltaproteobacteria bacterium]
MSVNTRFRNAFFSVTVAFIMGLVGDGCEGSQVTDEPLPGGGSSVEFTAGSEIATPTATGGTSGSYTTPISEGNGGTEVSSEMTACPATTPVCAGLTSCKLAVCIKVVKGEMPATCSCHSGAALQQCCAQVKEAMADCLDYEQYPECEAIANTIECPSAVLESLVNNPYKGTNESISSECQGCMCQNCVTELSDVARHGQSAIALLQCAVANGALKDCLVCSPPPCDVTFATNLMTGPCSQEALNACPNCSCAGMFDVNCISLAGCLTPGATRSFPCAAAHASAECMASKCPMCGSFPTCPSNLENFDPGGGFRP